MKNTLRSGPRKGKKQTKRPLTTNGYERQMISRLRSNTVEFASVIRGAVLDANAGGIGPQSYSFFLNYPGYYANPGAAVGQMTTISSVIANEQKVFDEYKVTSLHVKYLPWVTGQVRVNTAVAFTAPSDPTLVMSVDYDDSAIWSSNAKALNSQNPAIYHSYAPGIQSLTMRQRDRVDAMKWLNLGSIVPNLTTPPDPNNPAKIGSVKVRKFSYQLNATTEGTFYAEWTVLFKGVYTLS
jgi:hypothetical protein